LNEVSSTPLNFRISLVARCRSARPPRARHDTPRSWLLFAGRCAVPPLRTAFCFLLLSAHSRSFIDSVARNYTTSTALFPTAAPAIRHCLAPARAAASMVRKSFPAVLVTFPPPGSRLVLPLLSCPLAFHDRHLPVDLSITIALVASLWAWKVISCCHCQLWACLTLGLRGSLHLLVRA
jgi:hypothetical protein